MTPEDVLRLFSSFQLDQAEVVYLNGQAKRIAYLRDLVQNYCNEIARPAEILDVGPHFLTRCLIETIAPTPKISTLGYSYPKLVPSEFVKKHSNLDINDSASSALPFEPISFDIVIICEVIEHLFVPPDVVFAFLKQLLKPQGKIICGTPNAVSISKRLKMMMGENPFQKLFPLYKSYRGHIREYTMDELRKCGELAGLNLHFEDYCNYWDQYLFPGSIEITTLENNVPMYRGGLTIVYSNRD